MQRPQTRDGSNQPGLDMFECGYVWVWICLRRHQTFQQIDNFLFKTLQSDTVSIPIIISISSYRLKLSHLLNLSRSFWLLLLNDSDPYKNQHGNSRNSFGTSHDFLKLLNDGLCENRIDIEFSGFLLQMNLPSLRFLIKNLDQITKIKGKYGWEKTEYVYKSEQGIRS